MLTLEHSLNTYISLHIGPLGPVLDLHDISQHPPHQIFPEDDDLLVKVFQPRRVAGEGRFRNFGSDGFDKAVGDWRTWECR